ncbi:hypothetical protein As57867_006635, partial [Aphanomyces stellatus]
ATDVSKIVSLLDKEKESYVYGVGDGTYLVERVMQLANKQIKGYISWSRKVAAHATKSFRLPTGTSTWPQEYKYVEAFQHESSKDRRDN